MDWHLFLTLAAGHYLADFGLQNRHMAEGKRTVGKEAAGFHLLTAHAAIHALILGLLAHSVTIGLIVGLSHWLIDFLKASELLTDRFPHTKGARRHGQTQGLYGLNIDQALHLLVVLSVTVFVAK